MGKEKIEECTRERKKCEESERQGQRFHFLKEPSDAALLPASALLFRRTFCFRPAFCLSFYRLFEINGRFAWPFLSIEVNFKF